MRNPNAEGYNALLRQAFSFEELLEGTEREINNLRLMSLSILNSHYRLDGFSLYGEDDASNEQRLLRATQNMVAGMWSAKTPFAHSILNLSSGTQIIYSVEEKNSYILENGLRTLPNPAFCKCSSPIKYLDQNNTSSLILGWGLPNDYEAMDRFLAAHQHDVFAIHFVCRPVTETDLLSERQAADSWITALSPHRTVSKSLSAHQLQIESCEVAGLINKLEKLRGLCEHALNEGRGLWKTTIYVCSPKANSLASELLGLLSNHVNENKSEFLLHRHSGRINYSGTISMPEAFVLPMLMAKEYAGTSMLLEQSCEFISTAGLAMLCCPPHQEHRGYDVHDASGHRESSYPFSPQASTGTIPLGHCNGVGFNIDPKDIAVNVLITGQSQSGKTTTAQSLLARCAGLGIPFFVIEAVKKEYRDLIKTSELRGLQVLSFDGDAPRMCLDVLKPEDGTTIQMHIDGIKNALCSMSDIESPLPELIEKCLIEAYRSFGWSPNDIVDSDTRRSFPKLRDLPFQVDPVMQHAGYVRSAGDISAALKVRLEHICSIGIDEVLHPDVTVQICSVSDLFQQCTILELDALEEDKKAFVMGMLLARIREHLSYHRYSAVPGALLVLEEAHVIMPSHASSRGLEQASNAMARILAEACGLGLSTIVIDQSPGKINNGILINSGLTIMHRINYESDKDALQNGMTNLQANQLWSLKQGESIVRKDNKFYLVQIDAIRKLQQDCTQGCLFCHCRGTEACMSIARRIAKLPAAKGTQPTLKGLIQAVAEAEIYAGKRFIQEEAVCIAGRYMESFDFMTGSAKSRMIYEFIRRREIANRVQ